ncbi:MAG: phosphonate C-P lyase system protein PhnL [Proteobacteria bacterium]|nr:phosphonate C-P lyase system protein PhnL [Pseudomonadota bacterium]
MPDMMLRTEGLTKGFTLHLQGGLRLAVLAGIDLAVRAGECVALTGPSGAGKTTLLRSLYGTCRADGGRILIRHRGTLLDLAAADPRAIVAVRTETLGYVSQFLRVVPRVAAREIVAEAAIARGQAPAAARAAAEALLLRLAIPARLHDLPPATFSGGEQQRVNLARGFVAGHPILLLDEPTAALDAANRATVLTLISEAKARGAAIVTILHDAAALAAAADRAFPMTALQDAA